MTNSIDLSALIDAAVGADFCGAVGIDVAGHGAERRAFGWRRRDLAVPNTADTRFGVASVTKGLTALTVLSAVERGELELDTTARALLGADLPLIRDDVSVEQLLGHRSGIGDYLDEAALEAAGVADDDYLMDVPVHQLVDTADYLPILDGHPTKFAPDSEFSYCNGGYVVLALLVERAADTPFTELVGQRVLEPAGMRATGFLRGDELPGDAAAGYLYPDADPRRLRTNALHLPVRGSGDGGIFTTVDDLHLLWEAVLDGRIVAPSIVDMMLTPRSIDVSDGLSCGLGFWLGHDGTVSLHGFDAGVTCVTVCDRERRFDLSVIANTGSGAWPVGEQLTARLRHVLG